MTFINNNRTVPYKKKPAGNYVDDVIDGTVLLLTGTNGNLTPNETVISDWSTTDGFNNIDIFITSSVISAKDGIIIEYSENPSDETPNIRACEKFNYDNDDVSKKFKLISLTTVLDGFRIKFKNGTENAVDFFIKIKLKVSLSNINSHLSTNFYSNTIYSGKCSTIILEGSYYKSKSKNEYNDIWDNGKLYTGQSVSLDSAEIQIFSNNNNDTFNGNGARTVKIYGLEDYNSTNVTTEVVELRGKNKVNLSKNWWRIFKSEVNTAGSYNGNNGTITVRDKNNNSNIYSIISVNNFNNNDNEMEGNNVSNTFAFTVPFGKKFYLKKIVLSASGTGKNANNSIIQILKRNTMVENSVFIPIHNLNIQTGNTLRINFEEGQIISSGCDIKATIKYLSSSNIKINIICEGMLVHI